MHALFVVYSVVVISLAFRPPCQPNCGRRHQPQTLLYDTHLDRPSQRQICQASTRVPSRNLLACRLYPTNIFTAEFNPNPRQSSAGKLRMSMQEQFGDIPRLLNQTAYSGHSRCDRKLSKSVFFSIHITNDNGMLETYT
jgi:hypothetical protein